ncbi:hypothetical protein HBH50_245460 [Parastagonospora nodorum]|nr:hypothetical protein HBH50_245460 [Parastagonospora nodorum]
MRLKKNVLETGAQRRSTTSRKESAAAQSDTREQIKNYAKRNSTVFITRDYTTIKLTRLSNFYINTAATRHTSQTQKNALPFLPLSHPADLTLNKAQIILLSQLLTNNKTMLYSTPSEARKTAPLLVCSSIATTPCRNICSNLQTHVIRQAYIEVTAAYALNHLELRVLKLSKLLQDFVYLRQDPRNPASPQFLNTLIGTVLYNAIKEYHNDRTRKTIYFHSHTVENNYNAIRKKSNVTVPDNHYDNDCRTGHSNKEDIEADEREEETRVQLRELSEKIHDILLREFRGANDFTENEFAMLAEKYTIDNRIIHALALTKDEWELELEDYDALVERYEEEINCSDLYSTV